MADPSDFELESPATSPAPSPARDPYDRDETPQPTASQSQSWYAIKEIIGERPKHYKVEWEGVNPETGKPWPSEWVRNPSLSLLFSSVEFTMGIFINFYSHSPSQFSFSILSIYYSLFTVPAPIKKHPHACPVSPLSCNQALLAYLMGVYQATLHLSGQLQTDSMVDRSGRPSVGGGCSASLLQVPHIGCCPDALFPKIRHLPLL
jgi:hypothetical protein